MEIQDIYPGASSGQPASAVEQMALQLEENRRMQQAMMETLGKKMEALDKVNNEIANLKTSMGLGKKGV